MSMTAPTQRVENAIYTIFPVSFGFWLATIMADDPTKAIGIIALCTTFGTILLSEIGIDEWFVKNRFRTLPLNEHRRLQSIFLSWNAYQETWDTKLASVPAITPEPDDLAGQVDRVIQNVVSSQPVTRRLWRIRAFYFLISSLWFLVDTAGMSLTYYFSWTATQLLGFRLMIGIGLYLILVFVLYRLSSYRHRHLRGFVFLLASFRFLHRLLAYYESPDSDKPGRDDERAKIESEMSGLDRFLVQGDLPTFIQIWQPIHDALSYRQRREFEDEVARLLMTHWAKHIKISRDQSSDEHDIIESGRSFGWLIQYAREEMGLNPRDQQDRVGQLIEYLFDKYLECTGGKWSPRETSPTCKVQTFIKLLKTIRGILFPQDRDIKTPDIAKMKMEGLADPSGLYEQMPEDILGDEFSKEVARGIVLLFEDTPPARELISRSMVFTAGALAGFRTLAGDSKTAIEVFLRYVHQTYEQYLDTSDRTQIWPMAATKRFDFLETLYKKISEHDENDQRGFVLAQFFIEGATEIRIKALQHPPWNKDLDLYPVKDHLLKVHSGEVREDDTEFRLAVTKLVENKGWLDEMTQPDSNIEPS